MLISNFKLSDPHRLSPNDEDLLKVLLRLIFMGLGHRLLKGFPEVRGRPLILRGHLSHLRQVNISNLVLT